MSDSLQRGFELLLYGKDEPRRSRRHLCDTVTEVSHGDSTVGPKSPSTIAQSSPACQDDRTDAQTYTESITPSGNGTGHELKSIASGRSISSLASPPEADGQASWEPMPFHIRPFSGVIALAIVLLCVFVSLAILVVSNNESVNNWPISPTVYLAIVSAIANSSLTLARHQAIPVSWWYRASRGASLRALESHWHSTYTLGGAFFYGKLSLLTAACIATSFAIIDGPLLQRASTVSMATMSSAVVLSLKLLPELNYGFSGYYQFHEIWDRWDAYYTLTNWTADTAIQFEVPECKGVGLLQCKATVYGPGVVKRECTSQTWPITTDMIGNMNATWGPWTSYGVDASIDPNATTRLNPAFSVALEDGAGFPGAKREGAYLVVGLVNLINWRGSFVETSCWLQSAVVEYDVIIEDNTIQFDGSANQGRLVSLANNTSPANTNHPNQKEYTTLDAITYWLNMFVNANASVALVSSGGQNATFSALYASYNTFTAQHMNLPVMQESAGNLAYLDPTDTVILKYNQVMFRGGIMESTVPGILKSGDIDKGLSLNQTVTANQTIQQNVLKSDLRWYAGAAAIQLITMLLIVPMFWGWWTLGGTNYTMSPLTMALAFDSPLLADVNSAAGARGVVRELGNIKVKFGFVNATDTSCGLTKTNGTVGVASGRLGIAPAGNVVRPRKGMKFSS